MAAFYLDRDATIEIPEETRKLTKAERDHQHKINVSTNHKLKYYGVEYKATKVDLDEKLDHLQQPRVIARWLTENE